MLQHGQRHATPPSAFRAKQRYREMPLVELDSLVVYLARLK